MVEPNEPIDLIAAAERLPAERMKPPFTTLHGHVKYMRPSVLDPIQKMAMEFAFAAFFAEEQKNEAGLQHVKAFLSEGPRIGKGPLVDQQPFKYRRFSGGAQLPRGRYFTVAKADGDDGFALESELRTYVDHQRAGRILVHDGIAFELAMRARGRPASASMDHTIKVQFMDTPEFPNPFVTWMVDEGHLEARRAVEIAFPYQVEPVEVPMVIDLRLPGTQRWLYENVAYGLPGVGYYYQPNHLVPGLVVRGERPTKSELRESLRQHGGTGELIWYPQRVDWEGGSWDGTEDFLGLFPFLVYPGRGGSPITEAIGRWIQSLGAAGLVFPSSRTDVSCMLDDQESVTEASGWNFVDYREAPAPSKSVWIIVGPDSWWGLPARTDVRKVNDGRSWFTVGTAQTHLDQFEALQRGLSRAP